MLCAPQESLGEVRERSRDRYPLCNERCAIPRRRYLLRKRAFERIRNGGTHTHRETKTARALPAKFVRLVKLNDLDIELEKLDKTHLFEFTSKEYGDVPLR